MAGLGSITARVCTAVVAVTASIGTAGLAQAADPGAPGKKVVVLGDSYAAHGDAVDAALTGQLSSCYHGASAWPSQLRGLLGLAGTDQVSDHSCPGAMIESTEHYTLLQEARDADAENAFGPQTQLVAIQLGMNDSWGVPGGLAAAFQGCEYDLIEGCDAEAVAAGRTPDMSGVTGAAYAEKISKVVAYIKYYAPNAHIVLMGYPEMAAPGTEALCVDPLGLPVAQRHAGPVLEYYERIDQAKRDAAQQLGLEYFDTRAVTAGHGLCSPQPWVNGVLDPRADFTGAPFHPSAAGDLAVATALYNTFLYGHA
ncbi:SGNH/GDSL hydrolase family protein [Nocardia stercoris]|uniref:SGNH/GDSL hydrolase family protein n=1 Tax=Nocardia stercoris TaxID=2483361 RepID=A0A3M2L583_9NOCA|nr:SGNH/GDSL hydrolase family protein [Nocardia stercoris]RMI32751.1 SGNH/GDSL hydrolase family protein [Nocardia stercoris]